MKNIDNETNTATYLDKPVKTLQQWRWRSEGPPYCKVGRSVRYRKADVDLWLEQNCVMPRDVS